jgi:uncharacterized membrane protein
MFERAYRQRLEADLARWQADGVIAPAVSDAVRATLRPLPKADLATVVAIVGGLLIAAAFLAFIAANWTEIARPARFAILLAGIAGAYGTGISFDRAGKPLLADLSVGVASIIFGAAIALVGQMYHLGSDFAAGLLLWAGGALAAAVLTGSRGALAVALVAACLWSGTRVFEESVVPHWSFVPFWLIAAALTLAWNAAVARHLVALAAAAWWIATGIGLTSDFDPDQATMVVVAGTALLLGGGLALANHGGDAARAFGLTLSTYAAFAFAIAAAAKILGPFGAPERELPGWILGCGGVGAVLAFAAGAIARRPGPALAGVAITIALLLATGWTRPPAGHEPWLSYALSLTAMLSLIVSGMLDQVRPRLVAGWIGLASVMAAVTWSVEGSLLRRSVFLAVAGGVAVILAILLGRLMPKENG